MTTENEKRDKAAELHEKVKYTGFDIDLAELKKDMATLTPEFKREIRKEIGEKEMVYELTFTKSKTQDNYFFNSYQATLRRPDQQDITNLFYTDQRITSREAFNLLEGRSVEKKYNSKEKIEQDGRTIYKPIKDETYIQWRKLDFNDKDAKGSYKQISYGDKHGFNLEESLSKLPIKFQTEDDRIELIKGMRKGEIMTVTFELNGQMMQGSIEANPRAWGMNVYNDKLQRIADIHQHMGKGISNDIPDQSQSKKNEQSLKTNVQQEENLPVKKVKKASNKSVRIKG